MKLIFCVALTLILGSFIVDASAVDATGKLEELIKGKKNTKFTDLDGDCVFDILEQLDFGDFLNVVQIVEEFSIIAADLFRRKYSHSQIVVDDNFPLPNEPSELFDVAEMKINTDTIERVNADLGSLLNKKPKVSASQIELKNGEQILNTFKHFGHLIKRFKSTTYPMSRPLQTELIGRLISKHSSKSLIDIEIKYKPDNLLKHITNPLINVEAVTFRDNDMDFNPQTIRPNKLFPALRRLSLYAYSDHSIAYFDCHLPYLEHVYIARSNRDGFNLPGVLIQNPQIRTIDLFRADPEFVRNVSIYLPQLETLKLQNFKLPNGSIRFENVTTLFIRSGLGYVTTPANLHFPQLESLHIDYTNGRFDEFLEFLNEHNQLKYLHLSHRDLSDAQFQRLTANLTNLVETTLEHHNGSYERDNLSSDAFVEFLRNHDKLKQLKVINFSGYAADKLREQINHEWDVTITDGNLIFERKQNLLY